MELRNNSSGEVSKRGRGKVGAFERKKKTIASFPPIPPFSFSIRFVRPSFSPPPPFFFYSTNFCRNSPILSVFRGRKSLELKFLLDFTTRSTFRPIHPSVLYIYIYIQLHYTYDSIIPGQYRAVEDEKGVIGISRFLGNKYGNRVTYSPTQIIFLECNLLDPPRNSSAE